MSDRYRKSCKRSRRKLGRRSRRKLGRRSRKPSLFSFTKRGRPNIPRRTTKKGASQSYCKSEERWTSKSMQEMIREAVKSLETTEATIPYVILTLVINDKEEINPRTGCTGGQGHTFLIGLDKKNKILKVFDGHKEEFDNTSKALSADTSSDLDLAYAWKNYVCAINSIGNALDVSYIEHPTLSEDHQTIAEGDQYGQGGCHDLVEKQSDEILQAHKTDKVPNILGSSPMNKDEVGLRKFLLRQWRDKWYDNYPTSCEFPIRLESKKKKKLEEEKEKKKLENENEKEEEEENPSCIIS